MNDLLTSIAVLDGQQPTPFVDREVMSAALHKVECSHGCRLDDPTPMLTTECSEHRAVMLELKGGGTRRALAVYLPSDVVKAFTADFEAERATEDALAACEYFSHSCDDDDVRLTCTDVYDATADAVEAHDLQDGVHKIAVYGYTRQVPHERTFDAVYDDVIEALTSRFEEFVSPEDDADFPDEVHDCAKELRELMRAKFKAWSCEVHKEFLVTCHVQEDGNIADVVKVRVVQKGGR